MEKEDKEKWIEQLQHKLDDFSEDVPDSVWSNIERRIVGKRTPIWRRWQSIAAILVFAILSSVMVTLWNRESEYINTQQEKHISNINIEEDVVNSDGNLSQQNSTIGLDNDKNIVTDIKIARAIKEVINKSKDIDVIPTNPLSDTISINELSQNREISKDDKEESYAQNSSEQTATEKRLYRGNIYLDNIPNRKKSRQLSLALSSGGLGVNSSSNINGAMMRFNSLENSVQNAEVMSSPLLCDSHYQSTYFNDINSRNEAKTKKKHYQPVTFGLSLKYDLDKYWSLETGVTYSSLVSKLESNSNGNILHQKQNLKYIGIPLKLGRSIVKFKNIELYGAAGAEVEKCMSGKLNTYNVINGEERLELKQDIDISKLQFSLNATLGAEYKLAKRLGIYAEPGVVYYFDDKSGVESIRSEHPLNINIKLGVRFTFLK